MPILRDAEKVLPYEAEDSPFPEVRAVVRPVNDVSLPVNTVRMWVIGIVFTIVGGLPRWSVLLGLLSLTQARWEVV